MAASVEVLKALAVVCEITGTKLSEAAQLAFAKTLGEYDPALVVKALERCGAECKGRLTPADVISRIDDGRPGPEEAWSLMPKTEAASGCVNDEMMQAFDDNLYAEDEVAARMAFKEIYAKLVREARAAHKPACWWFSPGHDVNGREGPALEGLRRGWLTPAQAQTYLPAHDWNELEVACGAAVKRLAARMGS